MTRWLGFLLGAIALPAQAANAPNLLSFGSHASDPIVPCVEAALGATGSVTYTSYCPSGTVNAGIADYDNVGMSSPINIISESTNSNIAETQFYNNALTAIPNPNVPYKLLTASFSGYSLGGYDQQFYSTLVANSQVFTTAFCPVSVNSSDYPPLLFSTVLPVNGTGTGGTVSFAPWTGQTCGYGQGIEFSMSQNYTVSGYQFLTNSPSAVTAGLAGIYAAMAANHPTWNWFDIKAALRQTASGWGTGWVICSAAPACLGSAAANGTTYGYGNLDFASATALASPSSLYLQPPGLKIISSGYYAVLRLYPFRQTRRTAEAIYSVSAAYVWPVKNEYTTTDITASGATLLYTSNGTDVVPSFTYAPSIAGTTTFVAFTTDGSGNYSRFESFSKLSATLDPTTACHN